jgi:enamine deaminase RidA (YjgF/YER057c/UK114 family)
VMNALTVSAAFGLLVLIFQDGRLEGLLGFMSQGALESTQPIVLFAMVFGLSTDYNVFLLSRIKEARDGGAGDSEAVAIGLERTGRIVTAAAALFCVAIGAFAMSEIVFIKELGIGTALAVLLDATIVRALLVPSLMQLLGRWNWWAPPVLRRLHGRIGLAERGSATSAAAETALVPSPAASANGHGAAMPGPPAPSGDGCRAIRVGDWIAVSGTGPAWSDGSFDDDAAVQARRCMSLIGSALEEVDASLADVVRIRVYLAHPEDREALERVNGETFGDSSPVTTVVVLVGGLLDRRWKLMVEAEAYARQTRVRSDPPRQSQSIPQKKIS